MNVRAAVTVAAALAAACGASEDSRGEQALMDPGSDCLTCHDGTNAARFTVAGTFLPAGATVTVVDAAGTTVSQATNSAGNVYVFASRPPLVFPLTASVDGVAMSSPVAYGGCNACHDGSTVTTGPEMAPGSPCLACHGPAGTATAKFTAAGTFAPSGQAVLVGGQTATTHSRASTLPVPGPASARPRRFVASVHRRGTRDPGSTDLGPHRRSRPLRRIRTARCRESASARGRSAQEVPGNVTAGAGRARRRIMRRRVPRRRGQPPLIDELHLAIAPALHPRRPDEVASPSHGPAHGTRDPADAPRRNYFSAFLILGTSPAA